MFGRRLRSFRTEHQVLVGKVLCEGVVGVGVQALR